MSLSLVENTPQSKTTHETLYMCFLESVGIDFWTRYVLGLLRDLCQPESRRVLRPSQTLLVFGLKLVLYTFLPPRRQEGSFSHQSVPLPPPPTWRNVPRAGTQSYPHPSTTVVHWPRSTILSSPAPSGSCRPEGVVPHVRWDVGHTRVLAHPRQKSTRSERRSQSYTLHFWVFFVNKNCVNRFSLQFLLVWDQTYLVFLRKWLPSTIFRVTLLTG